MKKILLLFLCISFLASAAEAKRYIVTIDNPTRYKVNWDSFVSRAGGEVVETFDFIDGALLDLTEEQANRLIDRRAPGLTIEEDVVRYWLNDSSAIDDLKNYSKKRPSGKAPIPVAVPKASVASVTGDGPAIKTTFPMNGEKPWGIDDLKLDIIWKITQGEDVKVAVIDTGINYNHPDLKDNYAGGYNALKPGTSAKDDHGHGTHVAGIIAAIKDGKGVVGVAPKAKLYGIKAMRKDGTGEMSAMVRAVQWAIDNKMNVVNMSISVADNFEALHKALIDAEAHGITVVCSAGNDSGPVNYPAKYKETIAVSASSPHGFYAPFTSHGPEIDVMAPGMYVPSTSIDGKYQEMHGTSQAAPHIAGLAALAYNLGYKTPAKIREAIKKSAVPTEFVSANEQGAGIPNASKMKKAAE